MSVEIRPRRRTILGALLLLAFAGAGAFLSFIAFSQARGLAESRFLGDFRFDAYQRSELVRRVLGESQREFESLRRFYSGSEDITSEELEIYAQTLLEDKLFSGFLWIGADAARRFRSAGAVYESDGCYAVPRQAFFGLSQPGAAAAVLLALERARGARLSPVGAAAVPYALSHGYFGIAAAGMLPDGAGQGKGGFIVALISLEGVVEEAIGGSPPIGLPTAIYDMSDPGAPKLLMFHKPRLDAAYDRPMAAPDPRAKFVSTQEMRYFGLPWSIRVEASPLYLELRRTVLPLAVLVLGLALSAGAALYARRLFLRGGDAEDAAAARAEELARYFALGRDLFCIADATGRLRRVNAEWERCLGFAEAALVGRPILSLALREDRAATKRAMRDLMKGAVVDGFAHRVMTADGGFRWLEWRAAVDRSSGLAYAAARDVTERVRAEALLTASVREKEVLIREIHHRVKNNMQVISSLVSLESRAPRGADGPSSGSRIQSLLRAMALVHEAVYCSPGLDAVRMGPYLRDLVAAEASVAPESGAVIDVSVGEAALDLERATLCGLAADELVANSINYARGAARSEGGRLELHVEGGLDPDGVFWLSLRDNGPGIPEEASRASGLGLSLVEALVAQMDGKLVVSGSRVEIRVPPVGAAPPQA